MDLCRNLHIWWRVRTTFDDVMCTYICPFCQVKIYWVLRQEDIFKPGVRLTSCFFPFTYDMPCFCISRFLSSNIPPSSSLAWLKVSPQSHLMSKASYNNTTTMAQLQMPFSLSRQWYQVSPPFCIHCAPYSNCMCHAGYGAYQGLNDLFWNFNRVIIQQHDEYKHDDNSPMAQSLTQSSSFIPSTVG